MSWRKSGVTLKAGSFVSFDCSGSPQSPGLLSQQAFTALIGALTDLTYSDSLRDPIQSCR